MRIKLQYYFVFRTWVVHRSITEGIYRGLKSNVLLFPSLLWCPNFTSAAALEGIPQRERRHGPVWGFCGSAENQWFIDWSHLFSSSWSPAALQHRAVIKLASCRACEGKLINFGISVYLWWKNFVFGVSLNHKFCLILLLFAFGCVVVQCMSFSFYFITHFI